MSRPMLVPAALVVAAVLTACGGGGSSPNTTSTTSGATTVATTTVPPTTVPATLPRASVVGCPSIPARAAPDPHRPRYTIRADVDPNAGAVQGETKVRFVPDQATDRLVFRLWPNGPRSSRFGARLEVESMAVDGKPIVTELPDPTTLVARPEAGLVARRPVEISMAWKLALPRASDDRVSLDVIAGSPSVRLGSFFPILAWEPGVGWATEPAVGGFAEASTATTADFDLTVGVPAGFDVLASGVNDRPGHWTALAMRDVAVSVGRFQTATAVARAPQPVEVEVGVQAGLGEDPEVYLRKVVAALENFGSRFGPYPWPTFTLSITPELQGGIEYPGHVMQGPGTQDRTTSHEVGHQWFYGLVGNDQGRDPWLDEGLATWAELRFEGGTAALASFSVPSPGRGRVGEPMTYWDTRDYAYYRSVYVQGAQALAALGRPDLVDCALRVYVAANAYRIARPADLVAAAGAVFPNAAATLAPFGVRP